MGIIESIKSFLGVTVEPNIPDDAPDAVVVNSDLVSSKLDFAPHKDYYIIMDDNVGKWVAEHCKGAPYTIEVLEKRGDHYAVKVTTKEIIPVSPVDVIKFPIVTNIEKVV